MRPLPLLLLAQQGTAKVPPRTAVASVVVVPVVALAAAAAVALAVAVAAVSLATTSKSDRRMTPTRSVERCISRWGSVPTIISPPTAMATTAMAAVASRRIRHRRPHGAIPRLHRRRLCSSRTTSISKNHARTSRDDRRPPRSNRSSSSSRCRHEGTPICAVEVGDNCSSHSVSRARSLPLFCSVLSCR